jgi:hypothetical protein
MGSKFRSWLNWPIHDPSKPQESPIGWPLSSLKCTITLSFRNSRHLYMSPFCLLCVHHYLWLILSIWSFYILEQVEEALWSSKDGDSSRCLWIHGSMIDPRLEKKTLVLQNWKPICRIRNINRFIKQTLNLKTSLSDLEIINPDSLKLLSTSFP